MGTNLSIACNYQFLSTCPCYIYIYIYILFFELLTLKKKSVYGNIHCEVIVWAMSRGFNRDYLDQDHF